MPSFSLTVPESWWEFDVRPEGRDTTIRTLVDDRVRETPELAPYRSDMSAMLRKMAEDAHDSGALYLGCMAENFDGIPLSATITVSVLGSRNKQGVARVEDVPVAQGDSRTLRMVVTQTYVPVPGTTDQVALISGAGPVLDLADSLHDIFDAVTSTFRFV